MTAPLRISPRWAPETRGHAGMSAAERADALAWLTSEPADALCDMGGELIVAMAAGGYRPAGALEATTTGLHRLAGVDIPFPGLDGNGIALKDLIHNRHHVGAEDVNTSPENPYRPWSNGGLT